MDAPSRLRLRSATWLLAATLLALIPILAIIKPGLPNTADGYVHLLRAFETTHLVRAGTFYPRWAPDFYLGYGYPFFNFYAAGAHLLTAAFALAGLGVLRGLVAVQVLAVLLHPTGAFLATRALLRDHASRTAVATASLAAAAVYLYAPLRFRELFTQGNLSQLLALGWLPWAAWALIEALRRSSWRWTAAAGVALAGLVYAHHPSAFLGFPTLATFAFGKAIAQDGLRSPKTRHQILLICATLAIAVSLSAPFWLPAVLEMRYVGIRGIETGMFNVRQNLIPLGELLAPAVLLDETSLNPPQPISLGSLQALLAAGGLIAGGILLARDRRRPPPKGLADARQLGWTLLGSGGLLIACLAFISPATGPLWVRLPLARLIAFPWRLLGPALLFAAFLAGGAFLVMPLRPRRAALLALLVFAPLSVAPYLFPRPFAPAAEPGPGDIARYELTGGARATASANEYLPIWVRDPDPPAVLTEAYLTGQPPERLDHASLPDGSEATLINTEPLSDSYRLLLPAAATARFHRFYFPGWRAWVDGQPAAIMPDPQYGQIQIMVPVGVHEVSLRFGTTPVRTAAWVTALLGLAATLLTLARHSRRGQSMRAEAVTSREWLPWAAVAVILTVTLVKVLVVEPGTNWFRLRSPVEAPAAMQIPVHAQFANGIELIGYDVQNRLPRQGDGMWVRLYWRTRQPLTSDFSPFLHLDTPAGDVTWANQTKLHAGDKPTRDWPVGFYVVDEYLLVVPDNMPAILATLRAGWLDAQGQRVAASDGQSTVVVGQIRVIERRPLRPNAVPGGPAYRLGPSIRLLGHTVVSAGQTPPQINLTLYWQATEAVTEDYTIFVHVRNADSTRAAQQDGPPLNGWYPTSAWLPGQIVVDHRTVSLPTSAYTEPLSIAVGLYRLADGVRLPVTTTSGERIPDDQIILRVASPPE